MSATLAMPDRTAHEPEVLPVALALAGALHVALAVLTPSHAAERPATPPPLEVELAPPKAERPPPPPPPTATTEPEPAHAAPKGKAPPPEAPRPAAAGRLLTATEPAPPGDAPLDFVTDPAGTSYGFGVVSRGGTATGEGKAAPAVHTDLPPAPAAKPAAPELVRPEDLSERPRLSSDDPCRGYYPATATVDSAEAVVRVVVDERGGTKSVVVVSEDPRGEGFGSAARQCIGRQRFSAPRDREGRAVSTATTIRVRFVR
ncbi:MAG TPA: hypothetical protein VHE30_28295 [Polyangiaceae bacterium]|nr:hypothetical protein [Polyangiaceae bacterium]